MTLLLITGLTVFHLPHHAWLISGGVFLFAIVAVYIYFLADRVRMKRNEREKQTLLQESLRLQIFALQAQMRPHFIFNAINSIQSYILNQDVDRALHYLSLLAKLIRKTMENTERELIPLSEELEIVQHFLEIEKMRFDGLLEYRIEVATDSPIGTSYIPPLILQPFVDMAILHGIRQKDDNGLLTLRVERPYDHTLVITVTDNGPGWKNKLGIQEPQKQPGVLGYHFLTDRLDLLNRLNNTDVFNVKIEDLSDAAGRITGTVVKLCYLIKEG